MYLSKVCAWNKCKAYTYIVASTISHVSQKIIIQEEHNVMLPTFLFMIYIYALTCALTQQHVPVSLVSNGVDVWGHFMTLLATVEVNDLFRVDWVETVGVDHHAEQAGVCL